MTLVGTSSSIFDTSAADDSGLSVHYAPQFRVYTRKEHGAEWIQHKTLGAFDGDNYKRMGFLVRSMSRARWPEIGQAVVERPYGLISGMVTDLGEELSNLVNHQLRVDASGDGGESWETVWWGVIKRQETVGAPGGQYAERSSDIAYETAPHAIERYTAYEFTYELQFASLTKHYYTSYYDSGSNVYECVGLPSFNVNATGGNGGNRSSDTINGLGVSGAPTDWSVYAHSIAGESTEYWTDGDVVDFALYYGTKDSSQPILLADSNGQLVRINAYRTYYGMSAYDLLRDVLRSDRGTGNACIYWSDTVIDSSTECYLAVYPQARADSTVIPLIDAGGYATAGTSVTIDGGESAGITQTITLTGDNRIVAQSYVFETNEDMLADEIEVIGERIEVATQLGFPEGTLVKGWTDAAETAFDSATVYTGDQSQYAATYRKFVLDPTWNFKTPNSTDDDALKVRCDYRCRDTGDIIEPGDDTPENTSIALCELLSYLPCPMYYDLKTATASSAEYPNTGLHDVQFYARAAEDSYTTWDNPTYGQFAYGVRVNQNTIELVPHVVEANSRLSQANYEKYVFVVGLRLPHHVRMRAVRDGVEVPKRNMVVRVPDAHLWLGHRGSICGKGSTINTVERISDDDVQIYRDDRELLRIAMEHAKDRYFRTRYRMRYTLRMTCGLLSSFTASGSQGGQSYDYPRMCYMVDTLKVRGETLTGLGSIISRITYNNGSTTFETDWH